VSTPGIGNETGADTQESSAPRAYRVEARIKNNRLWQAIRRAYGPVTNAEAARRLDISPSRLGLWLNMRELPRCNLRRQHAEGQESCRRCIQGFTSTAARVARLLRDDVRYLFDADLYGRIPVPIALEFDRPALEATGMLALPEPAPDAVLEAAEREGILHDIVAHGLHPRDADVIRRRFGLHPYDGEQSLRDIATAYHVSPGRIHQIEATALRKLRHPQSRLRARLGTA
jgi:hypothetical protein